ncbi:maleylpyruvate isomerase N-terminal domain-containing protein [Glycomyces arizonensis]|uniref:maleylpyruvate isomerase N-terminal domain-containing protein n=1 Tax=Glycomyces arizonensis TaxID=256035 RepID=UPI00316AD238
MLSGPTPCEEYTVGAMLNHALGLAGAFTSAAQKERSPLTDAPPPAPAPEVMPEWRTQLPRRLAVLAEAWADPNAWEGEATAGGVTFSPLRPWVWWRSMRSPSTAGTWHGPRDRTTGSNPSSSRC